MKIHLYSAAVLAFATSAAYGQSQAVQWRVEDGGNGHWYEIRPTPTTNWFDACGAAISAGASLCSIESEAERAWLAANMPCTYVYLGGRQVRASATPTSGWYWITGAAVTLPLDCNDNPCLVGTPEENGEQDFLHPEGCWSTFGDWNIASLNGCMPAKWMRGLFEWSADCNGDGIVDYGQIVAGQLVDNNLNGIPDSCEGAPCTGDVIRDGQVNGIDLAAVLSQWGGSGTTLNNADINDDNIVDGQDLAFVLGGWGVCSSAPGWATVLDVDPPANVVVNPLHRAAIKATGLPWRVRDNATQIELVLIPAGNFDMGCSASQSFGCETHEGPIHWVTISRAFYMGRYEVTQAQWAAVMGTNPSFFRGSTDSPARPVESVSWNTIQDFLAQAGLRLPTEAEWEYAYRAGTTTAFHGFTGQPGGTSDDSLLPSIAWFGSDAGTRPVGQNLGNGFGLHDMAGNVWEWVADCWGNDYYASSPYADPVGPISGSDRVLRGGSWHPGTQPRHCRASQRSPMGGSALDYSFGFRVARNP